MMALERIDEADRLLRTYPRVREAYVDVFDAAARGQAAARDDWSTILTFLDRAERPPAELEQIERIAEKGLAGEDPGKQAFDLLLHSLEEAHRDLDRFLTDRATAGQAVTEEDEALDAAFLDYLEDTPDEEKEDRLEIVRSFVYDHPGHYIKEIHWRLRDANRLDVTYPTVWGYIHELEDRGELLTLGEHQGVRRHCFPHPACVDDRTPYRGGPYSFLGEVDADLRDAFEPVGVPGRVFQVNTEMEEILLLTPLDVKLEPAERIEGFGRLEGLSTLESELRYLGEDPDDVADRDIVCVAYLERLADGLERVDIPESFRGRFALDQAAGQT